MLSSTNLRRGDAADGERVCENRRVQKAISIERHEYPVMKAVPQGLKRVMKNAFCPATTFLQNATLSLSSRAKPRDLHFRGPLLEMLNSMLKQNCHLDRSIAQWRDLRFSFNSQPDL
jgi:hypothetical protein